MHRSLSVHEIKQALNPVADVVVCANQNQGEEIWNLILSGGTEHWELRREILGGYQFSSGFPFNPYRKIAPSVFKECLDHGRDTYNLWRLVVLHALTRYDDSLLSGRFLLDNHEAFDLDFENVMKRHNGKRIILFNALPVNQDTWLPEWGEEARVGFLRGMLRAVLWLKNYRHLGLSGKIVVLEQQLYSSELFGAKPTASLDSSKLLANAAWLTGAEREWQGGINGSQAF